jgi:3-keto-5-aminohexanoate cleavage enzyme
MFKEMFSRTTSLHLDPKNPTMDKKLVVTAAPSGAFTKREQNPHQPYNPKEIAQAAIECYKAGAPVWHVHCRDEDGVPTIEPEIVIKTLDMVFQECPDIITSHSVHGDLHKHGVEGMKPAVEPLMEAERRMGRKYIDTAIIAPYSRATEWMTFVATRGTMKESVEYLQERGIRPEFQIHHYYAMMNVVEWLIQPEILEKPYLINLLSGYHGNRYAGPVTPDPWGHIYFASMMQWPPEDSTVGATIGGHSWLPITVEAIMLGVDCVRVGMDDTLWMYPHKDELIVSAADVVRKIITIATELGREIATPQEARAILGLKP